MDERASTQLEEELPPAKRPKLPDFSDTIVLFNNNIQKRRLGGRKAKSAITKKLRDASQTEGEVFDIQNIEADEDEDEDEDEGDGDGPQAHQKRFYKGDHKLLVEAATTKFRIYLLVINAFPDGENLRKWTEKCFVAAGMDLFGARYKGVSLSNPDALPSSFPS